MRLSDFDYYLPKELIAQYPLSQRDQARLLVLDRAKRKIEHRIFKDIKDYLKKEDLLVLNDTKVLAARLIGKRKTGGNVEILLLERKAGLTFRALVRPARVKIGEKIFFAPSGISCQLSAKNEVVFAAKDEKAVYALGKMPLQPYIKREAEDKDNIYYQTVYAAYDGSVAAPTAGLHFTQSLLGDLKCGIAYLTLHVGYSTFKPVKTENILEHPMSSEQFSVPEKTAQAIEDTRAKSGRIFAVGTTSCRALEAFGQGVKSGGTDLFIYPGYKFKLVDGLLTNFHLPKTTLFMLACALGGTDLIKQAYAEAIEKQYRFYSYGDAMLIL